MFQKVSSKYRGMLAKKSLWELHSHTSFISCTLRKTKSDPCECDDSVHYVTPSGINFRGRPSATLTEAAATQLMGRSRCPSETVQRFHGVLYSRCHVITQEEIHIHNRT
jgi:hypothetical protein